MRGRRAARAAALLAVAVALGARGGAHAAPPREARHRGRAGTARVAAVRLVERGPGALHPARTVNATLSALAARVADAAASGADAVVLPEAVLWGSALAMPDARATMRESYAEPVPPLGSVPCAEDGVAGAAGRGDTCKHARLL